MKFDKIGRAFSYFIVILIIISIIAIFLEFMYQLTPQQLVFFEILDLFVSAMFTIDLVIEYRKIRNTKLFLKHYWIEIIAAIPFLPLVRTLKIFRFLRIIRLVDGSIDIIKAEVIISRTKGAIKAVEGTARVGKTVRLKRFNKQVQKKKGSRIN